MVCPFMQQRNKKTCPMAYYMPYNQNMYGYEDDYDEDKMNKEFYEDEYMQDERRCPFASDNYPMMMPMPMLMEFEDDE